MNADVVDEIARCLALSHRASSAADTSTPFWFRLARSSEALIDRRLTLFSPDQEYAIRAIHLNAVETEVPHPEESLSIGIDRLDVNPAFAFETFE